MKIFIVFEAGSGYGESLTGFTDKDKAKEQFEKLVNEYSDFTEKTAEEQQEVLDNEELQCDDGNVIKIIELDVN